MSKKQSKNKNDLVSQKNPVMRILVLIVTVVMCVGILIMPFLRWFKVYFGSNFSAPEKKLFFFEKRLDIQGFLW